MKKVQFGRSCDALAVTQRWLNEPANNLGNKSP